MRKPLTIALILVISLGALLGGGCQGGLFGGYTLSKRAAIDAQIEAARTEATAKMEGLRVKEVGVLKDTVKTHQEREQLAADYLFKGSATFGTLRPDQITRPTLVMGQSIQQTSAQLPPATATAQAAAFKALQTELDETKVSTEVLRAQYERELGQARVEGEAKAKALADLKVQTETIAAEKVAALESARQKEVALQVAKDKVQDKDLADKTREAAEAKSVQAMKLRFSSIVGALALLCTLGAIYSPVYKDKLGIAAVLFGLATVGIWYLEGWMVAVAIGVVVVGLVAWAAKNHYLESKAATNVFRAVQAVKDNAKEDYERVLKPQLDQWMTIYDKKTGKAVPDQAAIAHVDQRLMETGDK